MGKKMDKAIMKKFSKKFSKSLRIIHHEKCERITEMIESCPLVTDINTSACSSADLVNWANAARSRGGSSSSKALIKKLSTTSYDYNGNVNVNSIFNRGGCPTTLAELEFLKFCRPSLNFCDNHTLPLSRLKTLELNNILNLRAGYRGPYSADLKNAEGEI